jgi:hypothetical protein
MLDVIKLFRDRGLIDSVFLSPVMIFVTNRGPTPGLLKGNIMGQLYHKRIEYLGTYIDIAYTITFDKDGMLDNIEINSICPIEYMTPNEIERFKTQFIQRTYRLHNFEEGQL